MAERMSPRFHVDPLLVATPAEQSRYRHWSERMVPVGEDAGSTSSGSFCLQNEAPLWLRYEMWENRG